MQRGRRRPYYAGKGRVESRVFEKKKQAMLLELASERASPEKFSLEFCEELQRWAIFARRRRGAYLLPAGRKKSRSKRRFSGDRKKTRGKCQGDVPSLRLKFAPQEKRSTLKFGMLFSEERG